MNANFKMTYLSGGDDIFGPNFGGATVFTNVRAGYTTECPNVGKLLKNLKFSLPMENEIMGEILNDGKEPKAAATEWLKANPDAIDALARRRHHLRWRRRDGRREDGARSLTDL